MEEPENHIRITEGTYSEKLGSPLDPDSYSHIFYYIYVPPFRKLEINAEIIRPVYHKSEPMEPDLGICITDNLWGSEGDTDSDKMRIDWQFEIIYEDKDGKIDGSYYNSNFKTEKVTIALDGQGEFEMVVNMKTTFIGWIGFGAIMMEVLIMIYILVVLNKRKKEECLKWAQEEKSIKTQ